MNKFKSFVLNEVDYLLVMDTAQLINNGAVAVEAIREDGEVVIIDWNLCECGIEDEEDEDAAAEHVWLNSCVPWGDPAESGEHLDKYAEALLIESGYTVREARRQIAEGAQVMTAAEVREEYSRCPEIFTVINDDYEEVIPALEDILAKCFEIGDIKFYLYNAAD